MRRDQGPNYRQSGRPFGQGRDQGGNRSHGNFRGGYPQSNIYRNDDYNAGFVPDGGRSNGGRGQAPRSGGYRNSFGNGYNNGNSYNGRGGGGYNNSYGNGRAGSYHQNYTRNRTGRPHSFGILPSKNLASPQEPIFEGENVDRSLLYPFEGVLEVTPKGFGFLRDPKSNYERRLSDPFLSSKLIDRLNLRPGVFIKGMVQPPVTSRDQGPRLIEVNEIDGMTPEDYFNLTPFEDLTPVNPREWLQLETKITPLTTRVMDILTPLGKGQRALIVAPPRSGKTFLLRDITNAIIENHSKIKVIVFLVDERPEEVTEFRANVKEMAEKYHPEMTPEVIASSLDCDLESHIRLSQFVIERCKRLAEMGKDVFLLLDSITRLARAYNKWVGNSGRTMSGGIDARAMDIPKKIFSSARTTQEGGSLTIVGTALVDTGSRMDELIFQEFKGTGNMELVLDRHLADLRIWPAMDISKSGTRREEIILPPDKYQAATMIRRTLISLKPADAMERLTAILGGVKNNDMFFKQFLGHQLD